MEENEIQDLPEKNTPDEPGEKELKTVLIFGVSSFVGSNIAEFLKDEYKVVGTYHKNPVTLPGVLTVPCDVLAKEEVQLVLFAFKPDITIYAVGLSSVANCALYEELADALNTSGLFNVVEYCQRYKSQILYLSSNYVFAGEDKNYLEMDIPDAITMLGKTQASAEFYIQKTSLNYLIFRCCRLYGRGVIPGRKNWFEKVEQAMHRGESINCDNYLNMGFLDVNYLALLIKIAIDKRVHNRLFQVSTNDICSTYEWTKKYSEIFSMPTNLISKAKWKYPLAAGANSIESDISNFNLDVTNIQGFMNVKLPSIEESLQFTFSRLNGNSKKGKASVTSSSDIKFI